MMMIRDRAIGVQYDQEYAVCRTGEITAPIKQHEVYRAYGPCRIPVHVPELAGAALWMGITIKLRTLSYPRNRPVPGRPASSGTKNFVRRMCSFCGRQFLVPELAGSSRTNRMI